MLADETTLGATDRGHVEEEPEVRGEPHAPRVCETVGVEDQGIHLCRDLLQRPDDRRYLPERQQPRHVRKLQRRLVPPHLDHFETREGEHYHSRIPPVTLRRDVRPGDVPHAREIQRRPLDDLWRQLPLQRVRLTRREVQRMQHLDPHKITTEMQETKSIKKHRPCR